MADETIKLNSYRKEKGYDSFFKGVGVDIGCGPDPLSKDVFLNIERVDPYDRAHHKKNDANSCSNIKDETYDFVYSSHCLEHTVDPYIAFTNWLRICKSGGHLVHAVPHEIFYEKCQWPSKYNKDHKWSWTIDWKSNLPRSIHIPEFLDYFSDKAEVVSAKTILLNFDFNKFLEDQTSKRRGFGEAVCQIEFIIKKR